MGDISIHEEGSVDTVGMYGEAMTANSIMDIGGTWCNEFGEHALCVTLKGVW